MCIPEDKKSIVFGELQRESSISIDLEMYASQFKTVKHLVPVLNKILRIKLVDDFNYVDLKCGHEYVNYAGKVYLFPHEIPDLNQCPGLLISVWKDAKQIKQPRIEYETIRLWIDTFGYGFGSRGKAKSMSMNCYRDERMSKRPHPTPLMSIDEISNHQYTNSQQQYPLLAPINVGNTTPQFNQHSTVIMISMTDK